MEHKSQKPLADLEHKHEPLKQHQVQLVIMGAQANTLQASATNQILIEHNINELMRASDELQIPRTTVLFPEALFGKPALIDPRAISTEFTNCWDEPKLRSRLAEHARRKLLIAGCWTESMGVPFAITSMLVANYEVYFVGDASAGSSEYAHELGMRRMIQAGVIPMSTKQTLAEWECFEYLNPPAIRSGL